MSQENVEIVAGLVYGVDRQLREGGIVLTGFDDSDAGSYGCIVIGGREYEIVRWGANWLAFSSRRP
jgi:hypothetical protein